jgi:hypothetical protein
LFSKLISNFIKCKPKEKEHIDRWFESRLNRVIEEATNSLEKNEIKKAINLIFFTILNDYYWYKKRYPRITFYNGCICTASCFREGLGISIIEAMAMAAKALGYQYIAITDHSAGRGIAHGLDSERLRRQCDEIKQLNQR